MLIDLENEEPVISPGNPAEDDHPFILLTDNLRLEFRGNGSNWDCRWLTPEQARAIVKMFTTALLRKELKETENDY